MMIDSSTVLIVFGTVFGLSMLGLCVASVLVGALVVAYRERGQRDEWERISAASQRRAEQVVDRVWSGERAA